MEIVKKDKITAVAYEIKDAEYVAGSDRNAGYWAEVDFSGMPPYPPELSDLGEIALWKHAEGEPVELSYYFGCVTDAETAPEGFVRFEIGGADYAVFEASDKVGTEPVAETVKKVRACARRAVKEEIAANGYAYDIDHGMMFEYYKDGKGFIYAPVKKA